MTKLRWLVLAVFALSNAGIAGAQWKAAVTPYFASYFPVARLVDSAGFTEKQANAPLFGARFTYWVATKFAIDAGSGFTQSRIITETSGQLVGGAVTNKQNGLLIFSSARVMFKQPRDNFFALLGGSWVARRGDAWNAQAFPKRDNYGVLVGGGVRSEVSAKVSLWVTAELHLYGANFDGDGVSGRYYSPTLQKDLLVTIGTPITLLRR